MASDLDIRETAHDALRTGLTALMKEHAIRCNNLARPPLCLAGTPEEAADVGAEYALRERAALPGFLLGHPQLLEKFRLERAAAILSPGCAEADPLLLAWSLLDVAAKRSARMVKATATVFDSSRSVPLFPPCAEGRLHPYRPSPTVIGQSTR